MPMYMYSVALTPLTAFTFITELKAHTCTCRLQPWTHVPTVHFHKLQLCHSSSQCVRACADRLSPGGHCYRAIIQYTQMLFVFVQAYVEYQI